MLVQEIQEQYPVHYLVWNNEYQELERALKENKVDYNFLLFFFLIFQFN